jgi:ABC-type dipeptide/oligopeptide/nickel transport system permease component
MLDVLAEDYIRTAKAKGVATRPMLLKHALKNAGVPIVTVIGIGVALLIGGVVITETVFNIPGVGRLVVDAISKRDSPFDIGMSTLVLIGMSVPEFTVAIFLVMLFANSLGWFPPLALIDQTDGVWSAIYTLILPVITLNLAMTADVVRLP